MNIVPAIFHSHVVKCVEENMYLKQMPKQA